MSTERVALGILCGGFSRRMGRDKASVELGAESLLARMRRRLGAEASVVLIGTRPDGPGQLKGEMIVFDPDPGGGPLQSMLAMLQQVGAAVLIVPVDMPFLPAGLAAWLAEQAPAAHAIGIAGETGAEPLPVLLRPAAAMELGRRCQAGERRAGAWRELAGAETVPAAGRIWTHPASLHLLGLNTAAEVERAEGLLPIFGAD